MNKLKTYVDESLFGGKSEDEITQGAQSSLEQEILENFKKYSFNNIARFNQRCSPWKVPGGVILGPKGIEIDCTKVKNPNTPACLTITTSNCKRQAKKFPGFNISKVKGTVYLYGSNIESLEGVFAPDCEFDGDLIIPINLSPKLKTLKGIFKDGSHLHILLEGYRGFPIQSLQGIDELPKNTTEVQLNVLDVDPVDNRVKTETIKGYNEVNDYIKSNIKFYKEMNQSVWNILSRVNNG